MTEEQKTPCDSPTRSSDLASAVGKRIRCEDHRGKVHYVGTVATSKNPETIWLGIEWDDPARGKHDGAVTTEDGVEHRYYTCRDGHGSFIKPKRAKFGVDLVQMVLDRYSTEELDDIVQEQEQIAADSNYKVEFVGWDRAYRRQCKLDTKRTIHLVSECASHLENAADLAQLIPLAQLLDLRRNLFTSLTDLRGLDALTHLRELNLSHNRFGDMSSSFLEGIDHSFDRIEILKMNDVEHGWFFVYMLASHGKLPALVELQICDVGIDSFDLDGLDVPQYLDCFENLSNLNVSANGISDWNEILRFGKLEHLTDLNVSYNRLEWIPFVPDCFERLRVFWFRNNLILDLRVFDELNHLVSIEQLLFINNPMANDLGDSRLRDLAIAKVETMSKCNQSEVQSKERMDSEMYYLKWIQQEVEKEKEDDEDDGDEKESQNEQEENGGSGSPDATVDEIDRKFPRYKELVGKYGFTKRKRNEQQSLTMALVLIKSMDPESCTVPRKEKKLPLSMTVGQLKLLCQRFFKLDPEMQRIQMRPAGKGFPEDLEDDTRTLAFYSIKDGCEILMQSRNFDR